MQSPPRDDRDSAIHWPKGPAIDRGGPTTRIVDRVPTSDLRLYLSHLARGLR